MSELSIELKALLAERAELRARIAQIPFDGSIEVKQNASGKYLYARSRVGGKNKSTYIGVYSEEAHTALLRQAIELRALKKSLRQVEKRLAASGYEDMSLPSPVLLNADFARSNIKTLIYGQAVLEGVSTTFPQTEEILENGIISGMRASDVQKILNLKHAWEFVLDRDVLSCPSDFAVLSRIASLVNEGFYEFGGSVRSVPVRIGGCSYVPPVPSELEVRELLAQALGGLGDDADCEDAALRVAIRLMRMQAFIDGNKRAAVIFANHFLIAHGAGLLSIPEAQVQEFRSRLVAYYDSGDEDAMVAYMADTCMMRMA